MTTESPADRMPATVREWTEILARIRFGTVKIAGKNVTGPRIKLVAGRLANFADGNGTRVRPGIARLAVDLEMDYRAVGSIVAYLRRLGLLGLVRSGGGAKADEYRLTLPVDLLERDDLEVWSPAKQALEIDRVRTTRRGVRKDSGSDPDRPDGTRTHAPQGDPSDDGTHAPEGQASAPETHAPEGDAQPVDNFSTHAPEGATAAGDACPTGSHEIGDARPTGTRTHVPQGQATHQDLDTTTTHHSGDDVRTTSHPPRANRPDHLAPVVQLFPETPRSPRRQQVDDTIAEAAARRAAARAAHQARLASGEDA